MSAQDEDYRPDGLGSSSSYSFFGPNPNAGSIGSPSLPTSSPDMLSESDFSRPLHAPSPPTLSSPPAPAPVSAPVVGAQHHVDFRLDSRNSSFRPVFNTTSSSSMTPTRSPRPDSAISPRTLGSPSTQPQPQQSPTPKPQSNGHVPGPSPRSAQSGFPGLVQRSSTDRRVRSESLASASAQRHSSLNHGKRASLVTGGYATTDSDSDSAENKGEGTDPATRPRPTSARTASQVRSKQLVVEERRRRAHSLMSPVLSDRVGSGEGSGSGRSRSSSRSDLHRADSATGAIMQPRRDRSASISNALRPPSTSRLSHQRLNGRSPLSSTAPSRVPSTRVGESSTNAAAESSRHPSFRLAKRDASRSPPKRTADLPARAREVQRLRREDGISSPEGSRKGKERAHDPSMKRNGLATSLGILPRSESSGVISPDQIHEIFANSDVAKALRMGQGASTSRSPSTPARRDRRSSSSAATKLGDTPPQPQRNGLFMVTAPPALLRDEDGQLRDRTVSVSSSIAPPPRSTSRRHLNTEEQQQRERERDHEQDPETEPTRLRREARRRSSTLVEPEGGHVPFTHHLPVRVDEILESSGEEDGSTHTRITFDEDDRPASSAQRTIESTTQHSDVVASAPAASPKPKDKKRKGRISGLFRRSKKSSESLRKEHTTQHDAKHHEQAKADHAKAREQYDRDRATRQMEQERRDAELAEERKYRAFVEVSAHPAASKRATRAMSSFDALYGQIYDSFAFPPKVNPLAIIRWAAKTREQDEARQRYRAEQAERDKDPTSFPSVWSNQIYRNPADEALRGAAAASTADGLSKNTASAKGARSSLSVTTAPDPHLVAPAWRYTVGDISAYRAAQGRVNYFMPPPMPTQQAEALKSADSIEHPQSQNQHAPTATASPVPSDFSPPPTGGQAHTREVDLTSSLGSSHAQHAAMPNGRLTSPSVLTINDAVTGSPGSSQMNLNRTSSIDTGRVSQSPSARRTRHRTHQSMSAVQSVGHSVGHLLKGSRDKISDAARRQRTLPYPNMLQAPWHDSGPDEPSMREKESSIHLNSPPSHAQARLTSTPIGSLRARHGRLGSPAPVHGNETATDDDHHRGWNRVGGLFLKNRFSPMVKQEQDDRLKPTPTDAIAQRETLDAIWHREREFESRQAQKHIATERRKEAEAKLAEYEDEIYKERQMTLLRARERLAAIRATSSHADEFVRLQLTHLDQLKQYALVSAEVDVDFADLEALREKYSFTSSSRRSRSEHDKSDSNWMMDSATPTHSSGPPSRRPSSHAHLGMPPAYTMVPKPWPRRAALDREGNRIDPITQVELALRDAATNEDDMRASRFRTKEKLDAMDIKLTELKTRKDEVLNKLDVEDKALKKLKGHIQQQHELLAEPMSWSLLEWGSSRWLDRPMDLFLRLTIRPMASCISFLISCVSVFGGWGWYINKAFWILVLAALYKYFFA